MSETKPTGDPSTIQFTRSLQYRTVYSDFLRFRVGNGDITAIFGKASHNPGLDVTPTVVQEEVEIVTSWVQFKIITQLMGAIVEAIEQEQGTIPLPSTWRVDQEAQRTAVRSLGLSSQRSI